MIIFLPAYSKILFDVRIQTKSFLPAACAFIIATFLFCLPGDRLSEAGWLEELELDKVVHIGLFAGLVFLWGLPFQLLIENADRRNLIYGLITFGFIIYGVAIEFIQRDFIPFRSFDLYDIVADTVGCAIGWITIRKWPL